MKRNGFTLIELLVVIAIIAILAAILFPVFAKARAKARQTACVNNGKNIAMALQMYAQDYDERQPRVWTAAGVSGPNARDWKNDIVPYLKNTQVYICPEKPKQNPGYGYNVWFATNQGIPMAQISFPAKQLLVADVKETPPNGAVDRSMPIGCRFSNGDTRFGADPRHNGGLIGMFADGHTKWLREDNYTSVIAMGAWQQGVTVVCGTGAANSPEVGTYWQPTASSP